MWNNVINAWWPLVFYPATDAPRFTKGMWAMIGTAIATLAVTALVYHLEKREQRQRWVVKAARGGFESGSGNNMSIEEVERHAERKSDEKEHVEEDCEGYAR